MKEGSSYMVRNAKIRGICILLAWALSLSLPAPLMAGRTDGKKGKEEVTSRDLSTSDKEGWEKREKGTFYFKGGKALTGWQEIEGKIYYFASSWNPGSMYTGLRMIRKKLYYFSNGQDGQEAGSLETGWVERNGDYYYFQEDGELGEKGQALTGKQRIDGKTFYFAEGSDRKKSGKLYTDGWLEYEDKIYYAVREGSLGELGALLMDQKTEVEGRTCTFDEEGVLTLAASNNAAASNPDGKAIVDLAMSKLGAPYSWGANGPDKFDCSGLIYWVYTSLGAKAYDHNCASLASTFGGSYRVPVDAMEPGDLIICCGGQHVVIYIGNGQVVGASGGGPQVKGDNPAINVHVEDYASVYGSNTSMVLRIPVSDYL